jgi:hypothetical protein
MCTKYAENFAEICRNFQEICKKNARKMQEICSLRKFAVKLRKEAINAPSENHILKTASLQHSCKERIQLPRLPGRTAWARAACQCIMVFR